MSSIYNTVEDIRQAFASKLKLSAFIQDKTGVKTIEIIGANFIANESFIFDTPNENYIKKEIAWYESMSLNIWDMPNPPKIWQQVCDPSGWINSNYGWCIYSKDNGYQYNHALRALNKDKDSRRAEMIYNRPSMQVDYNKNGMSDFMCTNGVQYLIRNNALDALVDMRSNDAWAGFRNDYAWQRYVQIRLLHDLRKSYPDLTLGDLHWSAGSLHVYENQFHLVEEYMQTVKTGGQQ